MPEKNPQLDLSKEQRTSDIGLFMYAHSYWEAASKLEDADCSSGHAAAPTRFLYSHAIELFLKSYLRSQLLSLNDVKTMSHNLKKLQTKRSNMVCSYPMSSSSSCNGSRTTI